MKKNLSLIICASLALCAAFGVAACGGGSDGGTTKPPEQKVEKTLLIGDSIFDYWKTDYKTDLAGMPNLDNIAEGGTTSADWLARYKTVQNAAPTKLIIHVGSNNFGGLHQSGQEAAEGTIGIQAMLEKLHEALPDCHMYLVTVYICGETYRWEHREDIATCNSLMRAYCTGKDWVEIIETEKLFYDDENYDVMPPARYFTNDLLHFSRRGYAKFTEVMRAALGLPALNA